jgi:diacylglycerol kinase (ATP)
MRALLVHNPAAGGGRSERLLRPVLERLGSVGVQAEVHRTVSLQDACLAACQAATSVDAVLAMGGDGTVGACAAGLADAAARVAAGAAAPAEAAGAAAAAGAAVPAEAAVRVAALAIIPAGGGNDGARNLGLPFADPLAAATMLPGLRPRRSDLARAGERYVLNAAGAGFDAEVSRRANRGLSRAPGRVRYVGAVLAELVTGRPASFLLRLDGQSIQTDAWLVAVANSRSYGGGMRIAPAAMLDDGLLDVVIVDGELSKGGFLATFPKVFSGRHVEHPAVRVHRAARVELEADRPLAVHADGELASTVPVTLQVVAGAIEVLAAERAPAFSRPASAP